MGGITDRRFGESDPTMTPEERALQRFVEEKQRGSKRKTIFDLEDPEDDAQLTHFGQSLSFNTVNRGDDFHESEVSGSDGDLEEADADPRPSKRRRLSKDDVLDEASSDGHSERPDRRKSKKEVMEEVIAKSKLHKYERQQAKEDDDDLRAELDKGLPDLFAMLRGNKSKDSTTMSNPTSNDQGPSMNPDRLALLQGKDRLQADKEYDERLRQMAMDQRAQPTVPTLTEEEKLEQEARKLRELEEQRLRRMKGESEESDVEVSPDQQMMDEDAHTASGDADRFGLGDGLAGRQFPPELGVEDEDQFLIDDDLILSGSDMEPDADVSRGSSSGEDGGDDDDEFTTGLMSTADNGREGFIGSAQGGIQGEARNHPLAFTYTCPENHGELLEITKSGRIEDLPVVIQRIRSLYHPKLASGNNAKLGIFAAILVDHISYLAHLTEHPPFTVLEALIRHTHSLAKSFPEEVGNAFRSHLKVIHEKRPDALTSGDLMMLTGIGSIFPTSDHFHQVVTPAMLCMTRYLSQRVPHTLPELATGTYVCTLCLHYQRFSKRYIPEAVNYILNAITALMPVNVFQSHSAFPSRALPDTLRLPQKTSLAGANGIPLSFWDTVTSRSEESECQELKQALLWTHVSLIETMSDLWADKSAFCEIFDPFYQLLCILTSETHARSISQDIRKKAQKLSQKLRILLQISLQQRRPLRLHNHRPLAIKTSIPKFEETYNPSKHYDPDRERAELSKLKAEHKKERKGALRELRKDANFLAREGLREKKERDQAYETKFKKLVAEIQGEEGKEANDYKREKRMRKSKK